MSEKETEILVLKEMVRSTKSMMRAKEIDISKLKKKLELKAQYIRKSHELSRLEHKRKPYRRNVAIKPARSYQYIKNRKMRSRPNSFLRDKLSLKIENFEQYQAARAILDSSNSKNSPKYSQEDSLEEDHQDDFEDHELESELNGTTHDNMSVRLPIF